VRSYLCSLALLANRGKSCKYRPGQHIYLRIPGAAQPDGPYKIETIAGNARYTLCYPDGRTARDGAAIEEKDLTESST